MKKIYRVAGVNFDHMHMGDLLRLVDRHAQAEICGICDPDPARMESVIKAFNIPANQVYTDVHQCLTETKPDVVILCPSTARHAEYVELVAPYDVHLILEKPFAATLAEADRMIAAMKPTGKQLMINWPLRWYPCHVTAKRLIDEGVIGELLQVHYYDGNRGPLRHGADKVETEVGKKSESWFYQKAEGGGSLLDYLGYGVTLGTWFHHGKAPLEITCVTDENGTLEVDEHSVTIARYDTGLSKYETRWGTFSDPWRHQPQPKCGFILVGSKGTISSYDYEPMIGLQTEAEPALRQVPVDVLQEPFASPVEYFLHCLETGALVEGPLSMEISRIGQQIVESALVSAREKRTVALIP